MSSIKRVFAALGLAGTAALTQTGCDNGKEFTGEATANPMVYAMAAKCPDYASDRQKFECVTEATKQSDFVLDQALLKHPDLAASLNKACLQPIGKDVPNNFDVQLQVQANDAKKCLDVLQNVEELQADQEIKTIAEGVKQGLARIGL